MAKQQLQITYVELLQQHPAIWDSFSNSSQNRDKRANSIKAMAEELNITGKFKLN